MLLTVDRPMLSRAGFTRDSVQRARHLSATLFEHAPESDTECRLSAEVLHELALSGLPLAMFPRALGGDDLLAPERSAALGRVLRLIGAGDLSVARVFEGHVNAVALVRRYGTAAQLESLADAVRGGGLSAVWNAEGRTGLTAEAVPGGWALAGEKILASGAGIVSHPIVTPRTDRGVMMVLPAMSKDQPIDLSGWRPQGMRASATGTVNFDGSFVPAGAQIGGIDDYPRQPSFSGGAWRFCAVHLGAAERLLDLYRAHLVGRGRDGDPYQKQRIALCTAAVTTASFWIDKAAAMVSEELGTPGDIVAFVNLTRMVTERTCLDVLEAVHRGVGLGAFIRPDPIERISRDLATYLRQPVPDAAMADAAAAVLASSKPSADLWDF